MTTLIFHLSIIMAYLTFTTIGITINSNSPIFAKTLSQDICNKEAICKNRELGFHIENGITSACCPASSNKQVIKEYAMVRPQVRRKRVPLHKASSDYTNKLMLAFQRMKDLPNTDPRSFNNQAKLHCAYSQMTTNCVKKKKLGIHNSWLFFPFHRWYLYYFEKILGELINDPTFALPYWNWDNIDGMEMPTLFEEGGENNPLYDHYRNPDHRHPNTIVDLNYTLQERNISRAEQIQMNLVTINRQMVGNANDTESFFGKDDMGSIEAGCHNALHLWVGDPGMQDNKDMGSTYSASFDPLFYAHHANIDRMWSLWKEMDVSHHEPIELEWRNASYVLYDEKGEPIRVYNKDCLNLTDLGYEYELSATPWKEIL